MGDSIAGDGKVAFESCGHERPPRRVCDACKTARYAFTACSNECLRAHQGLAHEPDLPADTAVRARRAQADKNRRARDVWDVFASHRARVMSLMQPASMGGRLGVLGAGRCDDLDLPLLAERFSSIHLIDLDADAMERARDRQPRAVRDAIVLHGGVDVSGLLGRLDEWGESFPDEATLIEAVSSAAREVSAALGGPFEVCVSTCILSQLIVPFQSAWAAPESIWHQLSAALTAIHVAVLARSTRAGGVAALVFDVLSSADVAELTLLRERPSEEISVALSAWSKAGGLRLEPDPTTLLAQVSQLGIASTEPPPSLSEPWLWDTGAALHLVYALRFRRG